MFRGINHAHLKWRRHIDNVMVCKMGLFVAGCTEVRLALLIPFCFIVFSDSALCIEGFFHSCTAQLPGCHLLNQTLYVNGATALRGFARRDHKLGCENEIAKNMFSKLVCIIIACSACRIHERSFVSAFSD